MTTFACVHCGARLRRVSPVRPRSGEARPASAAQKPKGLVPVGPLHIRCPNCRFLIYDYPRPCAGLLVLKGKDLLVLRRGDPPRKGYLDTPGGFIDANEDIEAAARRELHEETGLRVGACDLLGMYWDRYFLRGFGYIPTMNFYYLARWRSGVPRAADDAASVEWMPVARIGRSDARLAFRHMREVLRDLRRRV